MDYTSMSDEEFFAFIDSKYGEDWTPQQIKNDVELYDEYNKRISTGV